MQQVQEENRHRMADINQTFYERLWTHSKFYGPENFNTWEIVSELCRNAPRRLEIGPGLRPRLPIPGTIFYDLSQTACQHLTRAGGQAHLGSFESIDGHYPESSFDFICLFDVIEHIPDDKAVFSQLSYLLADGGTLFFSIPLHAHAWSSFDALVGHYRRYDPKDLKVLVDTHGFDLQTSAPYGMQPKCTFFSELGAWWLSRHFEIAMHYHNRYIFPLALKLQKKLSFKAGLACDDNIDEVLVICRRRPRTTQSSARKI